jgi:hypothetical protein
VKCKTTKFTEKEKPIGQNIYDVGGDRFLQKCIQNSAIKEKIVT